MIGPGKRHSDRKIQNWLWKRPRDWTADIRNLRNQPFFFFPEEFLDDNQEAYENLLEHMEEQDFKPAAAVKAQPVTPADHLCFLNRKVVSIKDLDEAPQ